MRRLRHRLVQRLVAVLLIAGVAASVVPVAQAKSAPRVVVLPDGSVLDASALAVARSAARRAPTHTAAADAFVAAYVHASHDAVPAQALYRLLLNASIRDVPPAAPAPAVASAAAPAAPTPGGSGAAVLVLRLLTEPTRTSEVLREPAVPVVRAAAPRRVPPARAP